jgi:ADP-ribose pyrophosphatase YjhB (NUDIX family)
MVIPKLEIVDGQKKHFSVGAVIERNGKYLLLDRAIPPYGFAGPAGHVDEGEVPKAALKREVKEETGLSITRAELIAHEFLLWDECAMGIRGHEWHLYRCSASGDIKRSKHEAKSVDWYTKEDIDQLKLSPPWEYWVNKKHLL